MEIELRNERFSDYPETENVVREAFWNRYSPGCCEHYLIHIMRYSRAFVPQLDFVAVFDDKILFCTQDADKTKKQCAFT